jgi:hypothetical protein
MKRLLIRTSVCSALFFLLALILPSSFLENARLAFVYLVETRGEIIWNSEIAFNTEATWSNSEFHLDEAHRSATIQYPYSLLALMLILICCVIAGIVLENKISSRFSNSRESNRNLHDGF